MPRAGHNLGGGPPTGARAHAGELRAALVAALLLFAPGCSRSGPDPSAEEKPRITSLENGAVVPSNLEYPLVEIDGLQIASDRATLEIRSKRHALSIPLARASWKPVSGEFKPFLEDSEISFSVQYERNGERQQIPETKVRVARTPLSDDIIYRLVEPLFNPLQTSRVDILSLSRPEPGRFLDATGPCLGCHAYGSGFDVFNAKNRWGYKILTSVSASREESRIDPEIRGRFSFVSASPDGSHATVVAHSEGKIAIARKDAIITPFELPYTAGDLAIYRASDRSLNPLPGADTTGYVEDMPAFSPDGSRIVFSRYRAGSADIASMDLYTIPLNGGAGGEAVPVENASGNGRYHFFPKYSPDGKWLSFCMADGHRGIFAQRTSDIYLMSLSDHRIRKLNINRDGAMDSWHSWSSDSRWIVFSSKRDKGNLTALYLTHIDEKGQDHPPIKLVGYDRLKTNIPIFVAAGAIRNGKAIEAFINSRHY